MCVCVCVFVDEKNCCGGVVSLYGKMRQGTSDI